MPSLPSASGVPASAEALRAAEGGPGLRRALAGLDFDRLSDRDWSLLARALDVRALAREDGGHEPDARLALLGNFTLDLLPRYARVRLAREGIDAAIHLGAFGQYAREVLDGGSPLARFAPDAVFLALSPRLLRPDAFAALPSLPAGERRSLRDDVLHHVESWTAAALARLGATVILSNFPSPARLGAGVADAKAEYAEAELYLELNLELLRRFRESPRVQLFDLDRLASRYGKDRLTDRRLFYLAKMEWCPGFLPLVAEELARHLTAARGRARKVLVLDLDDTLWGGVVGEEGPLGVKVGTGDPESEAFLDVQRAVKALQARGVVLAACSKNNPGDVREVFEARPEMPLCLDDFAALEIGWGPKHDGLRRVAEALNVGLDSLVFVDDNPAEVELVRQAWPEVETVLLPPDPAERALALERLCLFEKPAVLAEDAAKTRQYAENRRRTELRDAATDLGSYLESLGTELEIRPAGPGDLPRVHQLFSKTNQFNLTTRRYTAAEIERFASAEDAELWIGAARDRFGDLGTVAAVLLRRENGHLDVDSFLLSCRAMGRGLETALMNQVKRRFQEADGLPELRGRFLPAERNKPVETFFEDQGFRVIERGEGGGKLYGLAREDVRMGECGWIRIVTSDPSLHPSPPVTPTGRASR